MEISSPDHLRDESHDSATPNISGDPRDRLRKALERNRARQAAREAHAEKEQKASTPEPKQPFQSQEAKPPPFRRNVATSFTNQELIARPKPITNFSSVVSAYDEVSGEEVEIEEIDEDEIVEKPKRAPRQKRTTGSRTRSKNTEARAKSTKVARYMSYAGWGFLFFLFLRLIFADGGVVKFYKQKNRIADKNSYAQSILKENGELKEEIRKLQEDPVYQKQIIRDTLGYISEDEFLILFKSDPE